MKVVSMKEAGNIKYVIYSEGSTLYKVCYLKSGHSIGFKGANKAIEMFYPESRYEDIAITEQNQEAEYLFNWAIAEMIEKEKVKPEKLNLVALIHFLEKFRENQRVLAIS